MRFFAILTVHILFGIATAFACQCQIDSPEKTAQQLVLEEVRASGAVFIGTVRSITIRQVERLPDQLPGKLSEMRSVEFAIKAAWKGPHTEVIFVLTGMNPGDCGYPFEIGKEYLVYAAAYANRYETDVCWRTTAAKSSQDVELLGNAAWQVSPKH